MAQQIQHRRPGRLERLDLLELELLAPGDDRAPDQLVHQHDHRDHRGQSPDDRSRIARVGSSLQVRTKTGQPKVAVAQHEHLACHQEKPAAGHRHHRVPDQSDGRIRQLQLDELLPPAQAIHARHLQQLAGDALDRGIDAERHVPDLPREDQQDRPELHPQLPGREQSHHRHHHGRQEAQHGDGLQRVQKRNHHPFCLGIVGGGIRVDHRDGQADRVGDHDARHREQSVFRQCGRAEINIGLRIHRPGPVPRQGEKPPEQRQAGAEDGQIFPERWNGGGERAPGWASGKSRAVPLLQDSSPSDSAGTEASYSLSRSALA